MAKTNYLICPGEACPLRLTCCRFMAWMDNEEDDADEMIPAYDYKAWSCKKYDRKEFYGQ